VHRTTPVTNQGITVSTRLSDAELEKMRADLSRDNAATAAIIKRFARRHTAMEPASATDYEGYYRLLTGVILGWEID
jgi:hypothetical protein